MSMNAMFVQVEDAEIARFESDPDAVESLFGSGPAGPVGMSNLAALMRQRLSSIDPQAMSAALSKLPEPLRQQLEASMGGTGSATASGQSEALLKLMEQRVAQRVEERTKAPGAPREVLSLDKAWHGVHYLLTGAAEPGEDLRSQAVLGGVELGDDPEGFSGYGPARYFRAAQVQELSRELLRPELESEAAARFDPAKMTALDIYPGWGTDNEDRQWLLDSFRRLRDFYASAASRGRAIVTCLV